MKQHGWLIKGRRNTVREKWWAREAPHPAGEKESSVIESPKR